MDSLPHLSAFIINLATNIGIPYSDSDKGEVTRVLRAYATPRSSSIVPPQHFSRKPGLASEIVLAGGGIGGAVMSIAIDVFIQKFGTAWAYRLIGLGIL